jgi:hypothetical protein
MADRIQKNIGVRTWKINMFDDFDYMGLATPIECHDIVDFCSLTIGTNRVRKGDVRDKLTYNHNRVRRRDNLYSLRQALFNSI